MEHAAALSRPSPRDPTGVPGLDAVLGGGLPRGALTLVVGPPGSGKTTLAAQMAFAAARAGRRVVILTALSEPSSTLVAHLRGFTFFDAELIGAQIQVLSLAQFLSAGLAATADAVVAEARRQRVGLVVLDGFRGLREMQETPQAARAFLYEVGMGLSVLGASTVITVEAEPRDTALFAEATMADVLLGAYYRLAGVRARRGLEAIKVRGEAPLPGLHGLTLNAEGVRVFPRLEARVVAASDDTGEARDDGTTAAEGAPGDAAGEAPDARAAFGVPALDALLGGGLTRAAPALALGSPGVGKTLLGLTFAQAGLREGEAVVLLGFHETRHELLRKADAFALGAPLRQALAPGGGLTLLRQPPVERDPDVVATQLLDALARTGARRLVVDSLSVLERAVAEAGDAGRLANYLGALVEALGALGVTTLFLKESAALASAALTVEADLVSVVAASVLWLQQVTYGDRLYRVLSVPKMRFSAHDTTLRTFTIRAPQGLEVQAPFQSDRTALAGIARRQGSSVGDDSADAAGAGEARS